MRELKFSLKHKGCWGNIFSRQFPKLNITQLSDINFVSRKKGKYIWSCLWKFEATSSQELTKALHIFKNLEMTKTMEILYKKDNVALLYETSISKDSIAHAIDKNNCFMIAPTVIHHGIEYLHVISENSEKIKNLIEDLKKLGDLIIERIGNYNPAKTTFNLTQKQKSAIDLALSQGYYNWPRGSTLEELAYIKGISRSTFEDHLRKAESKILHTVLNK